MTGDFYTTMAQVMPLLLLAFIWDSGFLDRLRHQQRRPRRYDPKGVWFWTKPRVRVYTLSVAGLVVISTAAAMLVLARVIPDSYALRIALSACLILVLATLLTRISVDVLWATKAAQEPTASAPPVEARTDPPPGEGDGTAAAQ